METTRLRTLQKRDEIENLLVGLVESLDFLPKEAQRLSRTELSPKLAQQVTGIEHSAAWSAWHTRDRIWFYIAKLSLPQSRERGNVVLHVTLLDEEGVMVDSAWWAQDEQGWRSLFK